MSDLRNKLRKKMEASGLSLRDVANVTGVSFSTIGRFLRGRAIGMQAYERLDCWSYGAPLPKPKTISTVRVKVGDEVFLITIEKVDDL